MDDYKLYIIIIGKTYGSLHRNHCHCRSISLSTDLSVKMGLLLLYVSKHPTL